MKWKSACGVLGDRCIPIKLKVKFNRTVVRLALLYGTEFWATTKEYANKIIVAKMRMQRWMCDRTREGRIYNEQIRETVKVALVEGKMRESPNMVRVYKMQAS